MAYLRASGAGSRRLPYGRGRSTYLASYQLPPRTHVKKTGPADKGIKLLYTAETATAYYVGAYWMGLANNRWVRPDTQVYIFSNSDSKTI